MSYTLKFEHPQFPDEYEFAITGLGVVKNNGTLEIGEDQERMFIASRGQSIEDAFSTKEGVATISGSSTISPEELKSLLPPPPAVEENVNNDTSNSSASTTDSDTSTSDVTTTPQNDGGEM